MILFGIHYNFFIVLPVRQKTCTSNVCFFFSKGNPANTLHKFNVILYHILVTNVP